MIFKLPQPGLGAVYLGDERCSFCVWAPRAQTVAVRLTAPREELVLLKRGERGYHHGTAAGVEPGSLYFYLLDGKKERPDPASRSQPQGVHGPSQVVDLNAGKFFAPGGRWSVPLLEELVFYELHVGTFTPEGTFDAALAQLEELRELGITALELMPVAQFPGRRNWGYDGVYPFAAHASYGGPAGFKRLVDESHRHGLAVFLDVVYNHLGPEGNYLEDFGPYFTDKYRTPWGKAVNFDGPGSSEVRRFLIENALFWITAFGVDGLRLDAVHTIFDQAALPFLEELAAAVHRQSQRLGRRVYVLAESDLNDPRLIRPPALGGFGLDAQWNDDFHHALHTLLTGEQDGYYRDFGRLEHLARAFREGYVYSGQYSVYRQRRHGRRLHPDSGARLVVFAQNHDQVGNRAQGERLSALTSFAGLKLAAGVVLLSPFLPLLFMGEEYGETAPFLYFTSHQDPVLAEAVRRGRKEEFAAFAWAGEAPDPQDEATFRRSRLNRALRRERQRQALWNFYRELLRLRRELPALADLNPKNCIAVPYEQQRVLFVRRQSGESTVLLIFSFNREETALTLPVPPGRWRRRLDAAEERWLGGGGGVPETLVSAGEVTLNLGPYACIGLELLQ